MADLVQLNTEVVDTALTTVDKALDQTASLDGPIPRDRVADQILRETLLTVSSDWPFMVSKDSAADYARYRAHLHAHATREIAGALASGRRDAAQRLADGWNRADGLFGALDARRLPTMTRSPSRERACLYGDTPPRRHSAHARDGRRPPVKILMVSWEYPPVVIGGLGRHVHHLATALAEAGHDVVVLSRRPTGTDPSTHPSSDEISEGVRVIAAAQDPHEFTFGDDMMAWTLAMGHAMIRAGLPLKKPAAGDPGVPTWCTRTTGWSPIRPSRSPNSMTCQWFPRSTRPRPAGIRAGSPARSAVRCTRSSRGWCANPIR